MKLSRSSVRSEPAVTGGTLVLRTNRISAQTLLDYLDDGYSSFEEIPAMFPSVNRDDAAEFLRLARDGDHANFS